MQIRVPDVMKCTAFFVMGALLVSEDKLKTMGDAISWSAFFTPQLAIPVLKGGFALLLAYLMRSPVPVAGSWFKQEAVDPQELLRRQQESASGTVSAASVTVKSKDDDRPTYIYPQ